MHLTDLVRLAGVVQDALRGGGLAGGVGGGGRTRAQQGGGRRGSGTWGQDKGEGGEVVKAAAVPTTLLQVQVSMLCVRACQHQTLPHFCLKTAPRQNQNN